MEDGEEIGLLADGPLSVTNLDDHRREVGISLEDLPVRDSDDAAIHRLMDHMRHKPSNRRLGEETLLRKAEDLYVALCRTVGEGADDEQVQRIASLFGESPRALKLRLS